MKQFHSFKSALEYQERCPLCQGFTHINDRDLAADIGYDYRGEGQRVTFYVNRREDDTITINPATDEVELILANRMPDKIYDATTHSITTAQPSLPIYNGKLLHALTIDCKNCCQYSYTLQLHFDLAEERLTGIFLNSETLSIENDAIVHEIKNVYSAEETRYTYFLKDGVEKSSILPLVPLNLTNPNETVSRIRKLLVFS
jgi:hypothetical protein